MFDLETQRIILSNKLYHLRNKLKQQGAIMDKEDYTSLLMDIGYFHTELKKIEQRIERGLK